MSDSQPSGYSSRPVPDPTVLTTQALEREIGALKDQFNRSITLLQTEMDARFDNQTQLLDRVIQARTNIDAEILRRTDLQFELVERQRVEQKKDTKDAVDAALTAQKEAVKEQTTASERAIAKSETATNKQLEQLASTFTTAITDLRRSIDEVKEQVGEVRQLASSYGQQKQGSLDARSALAWGLTSILALLTIGAILFAALKP